MENRMFKTLSLRQMADLTCKADGITDPSEREARYQKFRVMTRLGLIESESEEISRGRPAEYSVERFCAARLMIALYELGIDPSQIRGVTQTMFKAVDARLMLGVINGHFPPRGIDAFIASVADESIWNLRLIIKRDTSTGEKFTFGEFLRQDQPVFSTLNPLSKSDLWNAENIVVLAELDIPATSLLKSALKALNADA
jgi:hypothetical protein